MKGLSEASTGDYRETIVTKAGLTLGSCRNSAEDPSAMPGRIEATDLTTVCQLLSLHTYPHQQSPRPPPHTHIHRTSPRFEASTSLTWFASVGSGMRRTKHLELGWVCQGACGEGGQRHIANEVSGAPQSTDTPSYPFPFVGVWPGNQTLIFPMASSGEAWRIYVSCLLLYKPLGLTII